MNCLRRNTRPLLTQTQVALRRKAPATRCYHHHGGHAAPRRVMQDPGLIRGSAHIKSALPLRPLSTSPRPPRSFVLGKLAAATATAAVTLSATAMAVCSSHYDREIVPCTNRSHLLLYSHQEERDLGESVFADAKAANYETVDPHDPASVRVRLIAERVVGAAHRGLGIDDDIDDDAPMLRVTAEKRPKWGRKACAPRPHTSHLRGLDWEVLLVRDGDPAVDITPAGKIVVSTGFLDRFKTDDEIAAVLAHEVGHVIARHQADVAKWAEWLPTSVRLFFARRFEIEADYIGILLLGAAGFDPRWALVIIEKLTKFEGHTVLGNVGYGHPDPKKRLRLLSQPKIMEEAMELYREVTAMDKIIDRYFR